MSLERTNTREPRLKERMPSYLSETQKRADEGLGELVTMGVISPQDADRIRKDFLSYTWDPIRHKHKHGGGVSILKAIVADIVFRSASSTEKILKEANPFVDQSKSTEVSERLHSGEIPQAEAVFALFDGRDSFENIKRRQGIAIKIIDKEPLWWHKKFGTTAISLTYEDPNKQSVVILPSNLKGIEHELVHCMPEVKGFSDGKFRVIGSELEECLIDLLVGKPQDFRNYMNDLLKPMFESVGGEAKGIILDALKGDPKRLYDLIESKFGKAGLGMMLLTTGGSSGPFPDLFAFHGHFNNKSNNPYYKTEE